MLHCKKPRSRHTCPCRFRSLSKRKKVVKHTLSAPRCFFAWGPVLLLANLKDEDLRKVVHGPAGTSGGIVKCSCSAIAEHYDHKREKAETHYLMTWKHTTAVAADKSKRHHVWDFIFHRDDNSSCWLHPNFGDNKVEYGEGAAVAAISLQGGSCSSQHQAPAAQGGSSSNTTKQQGRTHG